MFVYGYPDLLSEGHTFCVGVFTQAHTRVNDMGREGCTHRQCQLNDNREKQR